LRDILQQATVAVHGYGDLSGELPNVDVAIGQPIACRASKDFLLAPVGFPQNGFPSDEVAGLRLRHRWYQHEGTNDDKVAEILHWLSPLYQML
jgi:hypothetical protein